jgi:hypothetical protein
LTLPPGAPVADDGAVIGDDAAAAFPLSGVVVEVGAACCLGAVLVALAVGTAGTATDRPAAVEAGTEQATVYRCLRRLRAASSRLQPMQRGVTLLPEPG